MDVPIVSKRCLKVVKLVMGFHHHALKVVEYMIELHHRSCKEGEASVGASLMELLHLYELMSNQLYKKN